VAIGTVLAYGDGAHHVAAALWALVAALLIQVGTNFANDYFDHHKGADTAERLGPIRAVQAGLVSPQAMRRATIAVFLLATVCGAYLVVRGGWPVAAIGLVSIAAGVAYTAGPCPLAYVGLGDLFVLVFFGPVAVAGTYYVQALALRPEVVVAGLGPGLLSVALLTVNNLRDVDQDRLAGKRTLAVRLGRGFARSEYVVCVVLAAALPVVLYRWTGGRPWAMLTLLTLVAALPALRMVIGGTVGPSLNRALAGTGRALLDYSLLFGVGWLL